MPHRPRPRPTLARLLTQAVLTTLAITTGVALLVMGSAGMASPPARDAPQRSTPGSEPVKAPESRLMKRYDCSTEGFGVDASPQSALVQGQAGKVRAVTFDEGWAVHTSSRDDGVLVAVCLLPLP